MRDADVGPGEAAIRARFRRAFHLQNALGRTTESIARELGLPPSTVRNYAAGQRTPPPDRWPVLAQALGQTEMYFLRGDDATDDARALELLETIAELSRQVAELGELLAPLLDGEPIPSDPRALQELGRALGRIPRDGHRRASPAAVPGTK